MSIAALFVRRRCAAPAAIVFLIAACATGAPAPALVRAKQLYDSLQSTGAPQRVGTDLVGALAAIQETDSAIANGWRGDYISALADIALRRTQTADAENARLIAAHAADSLRMARFKRLAGLDSAQREALRAAHRISETDLDTLRQRALSGSGDADTMENAAASADGRLYDALDQLRALVVEITSLERTERGIVITLSDILFDVDQPTLKPGAEQNLERIAAVLRRYPHRGVAVEGHADVTGSHEENQRLSATRAAAVRNALVAGGVDSTRVTARGWGETQPVASNTSMGGRERNQRVEIIVVAADADGDGS